MVECSNYIYDNLGRVSGSIISSGTTTEINSVAVNGLEGVMTGARNSGHYPSYYYASRKCRRTFYRSGMAIQRRLKVNEFGSATDRTNALGQRTQIGRDANNNPIRITDAVWPSNGLMNTITGATLLLVETRADGSNNSLHL